MESRLKLSSLKVRALENLIKTFDRLGLMDPYIITVEMKPTTYLNKHSNIEYEKPERMYGVVIRIMNHDGVVRRITIDD